MELFFKIYSYIQRGKKLILTKLYLRSGHITGTYFSNEGITVNTKEKLRISFLVKVA
jgi:hypothetical protein